MFWLMFLHIKSFVTHLNKLVLTIIEVINENSANYMLENFLNVRKDGDSSFACQFPIIFPLHFVNVVTWQDVVFLDFCIHFAFVYWPDGACQIFCEPFNLDEK